MQEIKKSVRRYDLNKNGYKIKTFFARDQQVIVADNGGSLQLRLYKIHDIPLTIFY